MGECFTVPGGHHRMVVAQQAPQDQRVTDRHATVGSICIPIGFDGQLKR
jgi:hypothetical protein